MSTQLFSNVNNQMSRNSLAKMLIAVVNATTDPTKLATVPPTNYETLPVEKVEKLVKADATFLTLGPISADGKSQLVQATAAGIAAVQAADPIVVAPRASSPAGGYIVDTTTVELPPAKRGGDGSKTYPFDSLTVYPAPGSSFFVPISETMPNPGKTIASTVSSATRRYKSANPPRVFTIRADATGPDGVTKGARVWRIDPKTATAAQASGSDATATAQ